MMTGRMTPLGAAMAVVISVAVFPHIARGEDPERTGPDELTADAIRDRLKLVEEDSSLEESVKARLVEAYKQAVDDLARAGEWARKAAEFEKARQEAPARLESIRAELAVPAAR